MKVALYARYSSDNQRDASIADQLRVCRAYAERQGWSICEEYTDHAVSGATLLRAGFQALMRDALTVDSMSYSPSRWTDSAATRKTPPALQTTDIRRREHRHACRRRHHPSAHRIQGDDERPLPE